MNSPNDKGTTMTMKRLMDLPGPSMLLTTRASVGCGCCVLQALLLQPHHGLADDGRSWTGKQGYYVICRM